FPAYRGAASNQTLDERWVARAAACRALEPAGFIATGWESKHPKPIFFDLRLSGSVHPTDSKTGKEWELCRDDALLRSKGLPEYSQSLARYLYLPGHEAETRFLPASDATPENEATQPLPQALGNLIPFNPAGGLMMVRTYAPL